MRAWLLKAGDRLRESYWFLPAVMAAAAMLLAAVMIYVDSRQGSGWMDGVPWLYAARPEGARQLLSAIGGSMVTVAGTVFSITIAAVVYASGQYGPRLLSNFMADRGNQVTLGTFIATFLYSIIVLRTIRSPGESGAGAGAFVPQLAVIVALILALCSIGVLIYFIHHVPMRIHINNVIERIGRGLLREIDHRFPAFIGSDPDEAGGDEKPGGTEGDDTTDIAAADTGYLQFVDDEALMRVASAHDLLIRIRARPGGFTHAGRLLATAAPAGRCGDDAVAALRDAFTFGARRTALQDMGFLIDELVEIAARALSPGVNDPFTARTCLDWLGAALGEVGRRQLPASERVDDGGTVRVIAHPIRFEDFLNRAIGSLAQYAAADRIAAVHVLETLGEVAKACRGKHRIAATRAEALAFIDLTQAELEAASRRQVEDRGVALIRLLDRLARQAGRSNGSEE